MKVLYLGPESNISGFLGCGAYEEPLTVEKAKGYDFLVSYGYRHIISQEVLDLFPRRAVNLHVSYLPYNRGASPNYWSFVDDTPKGVSIHLIDSGVDTGEIISRESLDYHHDDTLRTFYYKLKVLIEGMFMNLWPDIQSGHFVSHVQGEGTFHTVSETPDIDYDTLCLDMEIVQSPSFFDSTKTAN